MDQRSRDYETLIKPIESRMIRTVWRIVMEPDDVEDVFQEALEKIWKQLDRIPNHANPHALILRICINTSYDFARKKARLRRREELEAIPEAFPDSKPSVVERLQRRETRNEIMAAISRLPRKQALAVTMRFVQELPYEDIAQALGCREATVRKRIARARATLREVLAHLGPRPAKEEA